MSTVIGACPRRGCGDGAHGGGRGGALGRARVLAARQSPPAGITRVGRSVQLALPASGARPGGASHEEPLEVVPDARDCAPRVALGLFRLPRRDLPALRARPATRSAHPAAALRLVASSSVPVVGAALDRFGCGGIASRVHRLRKLRGVQKWCEPAAATQTARDERRRERRGPRVRHGSAWLAAGASRAGRRLRRRRRGPASAPPRPRLPPRRSIQRHPARALSPGWRTMRAKGRGVGAPRRSAAAARYLSGGFRAAGSAPAGATTARLVACSASRCRSRVRAAQWRRSRSRGRAASRGARTPTPFPVERGRRGARRGGVRRVRHQRARSSATTTRPGRSSSTVAQRARCSTTARLARRVPAARASQASELLRRAFKIANALARAGPRQFWWRRRATPGPGRLLRCPATPAATGESDAAVASALAGSWR